MAFWLFIFLLFAVGDSKPTNPINQTNLQAAIADMRTRSYHGFFILLKIVNNSIPDSLQNSGITFLMPNDHEISEAAVTPDQIHEFILSHSIPTVLDLLRFPNGTLAPSNIPSKIITVTKSKRSSLLLKNAKIVTPNVCHHYDVQRPSCSCRSPYPSIFVLPVSWFTEIKITRPSPVTFSSH
ncbi:unnamed protein product [Malus baccata var. baccata]